MARKPRTKMDPREREVELAFEYDLVDLDR